MAVRTGTQVAFPNHDDEFHNVFSYSRAKRFDLGRFRKDEQSPLITFDQPGLVKIYCEIHKHMRSLLLVLDTPWFVETDSGGRFQIEHVPPGTYRLRAFLPYGGDARFASDRRRRADRSDHVAGALTLQTKTTFRTKLLQAILAVVAASTAASLFVAQRQSSETYDALVDELFRSQAAAFQREHEMRLEVAAGEIERLAMSVRLFAALEENDPEVYKVAGDELREGEFAFFRLLDARGNVIPPPADGRAGAFDLANVRGVLVPQGAVANDPAKVQVGFIEMLRGTQPSVAYRIMSTPISNFDTTVGSLILGQRIRRLGTEADQPNEGLHSALWIDGRLVGGDVPAALHDALAVALDATHPDASIGDELAAEGRNYRFDRFRLNEGSPYPPVDLVSVFPIGRFRSAAAQSCDAYCSYGCRCAGDCRVGRPRAVATTRAAARGSGCCDTTDPSGRLRSRVAAVVHARNRHALRIVQRHGGRARAEGPVPGGAASGNRSDGGR